MTFNIRKADGTFQKVDFKDLTSLQQELIMDSASKKVLKKIIMHLLNR
jgi:hypothetical protein